MCIRDRDTTWAGLEWMNANDYERSIFSFVRKSKDGKNNLLFVISFTPVSYTHLIGVDAGYTLNVNSSAPMEEPFKISAASQIFSNPPPAHPAMIP